MAGAWPRSLALALAVSGGLSGILGTVFTVGTAPFNPAAAQIPQIQRIAAVVNDEVISLRDVRERLALTMLTSAIPNTPENRQKLLPSVLQALIDDQLRLQEAKRLKITVSDSEVQEAIRRLEKINGMPAGALPELLRQAGVPISALEKQIRPRIAWAKVARASLRRRISVQPEEVKTALAQLKATLGQPQRRVSELVIPVTSPGQETEAKALAGRLIEQWRHGANFGALAQQFSASATAIRGGDLGWVSPERLSPEIDAVLSQMQPGQISRPLRTANGYVLLMVTGLRQPGSGNPDGVVFHLSQLYMPLHGAAAVPPQKRREIERRVQAGVGTCEDMNTLAKEFGLPKSGDIGTVSPANLPGPLAQAVQPLRSGQVSRPVTLGDAEVLLMVCQRKDARGLPSRDEMVGRLKREKMEKLANRRLRDLRRQALIDIRL